MGTASNQIQGNPAFHNDWQYKVAVAFMLGHDYGFKRIMSSYYFQDTDQGPPGGAPASYPDICGNGWTCEHRWSSIMNMAQFANKVIGQPVTNWDASGTTLGFARGNVGFLALGDLGKEINTPSLPSALAAETQSREPDLNPTLDLSKLFTICQRTFIHSVLNFILVGVIVLIN